MEFEDIKNLIDEQLSSLDEKKRTLVVILAPLVLAVLVLILLGYPLFSMKNNCMERHVAFKEKLERLKASVLDYEKLKQSLIPVETKVKRASNVEPSVFLKNEFQKRGIKVKSIKVVNSSTWNGFKKLTLTVSFSEAPLNKVARAIFELENSRYYIKDSAIDISDEDGDGLVSGKVSFEFYGSKK